MIEAKISDVLFVQVSAAVAASSLPTLPIKFPGRKFTIPGDNKYLEIFTIKANPTGEYYGNERTYQGTLRGLLHWPLDDAGAIPILTFLDELAGLIPKGARYAVDTYWIMIYDTPDVGNEVEDRGDRFYPISWRYRCFYSGV